MIEIFGLMASPLRFKETTSAPLQWWNEPGYGAIATFRLSFDPALMTTRA